MSKFLSIILLAAAMASCAGRQEQRDTDLAAAFDNPPMSARPSCFWWWFNSLVNKEGITRDLEEFKARGMGGVTLVCSGNDYGVAEMPRGPVFLSAEWFKLYRFALDEAARLGLEVGVNFGGGGWCIGGAWITPEYNCRWFVQSDTTLEGPAAFSGLLPAPHPRDGYKPPHYGNVTHYMTWPADKMDYRTSAVVAFRVSGNRDQQLADDRLGLLDAKSNRKDAPIDIAPDAVMGVPLTPWATRPGDKPVPAVEVVDLTGRLKADGTLDWTVPDGQWKVITTGHVATGADVRCVLPEVGYVLEVDWLSKAAMEIQFRNLGEQLIREAGPHAGKTLKFFHSDSFEDGFPNWTDSLLQKFMIYRGYDPVPYLPVLRGYLVGSAEMSDRFLYDYRKTVADCFADGSYGRLAELSHARGILLQSEAAGPSWSGTVCFDALKNLGRCDYPMGEFWVNSWPDALKRNGQNFVGKQTASAAHIYGRATASAESFTGGGHWQESPGMLKPYADMAFCEGINRLVFHTMTSTRPADGLPGYEYGAGTHFNPNVTWWDQAAAPWLAYINRCQTLLQSGLFVADVLYYNGDGAPNVVEVKHADSLLGRGYDYDVCNTEVLLTRLKVTNGRLTLPDGMSYRLLVLPESETMPVEVIRRIRELVEQGATIVGPKPLRDPGLRNYPVSDREVQETAAILWGTADSIIVDRKVGRGRVVTGKSLRELLTADGIMPDIGIRSSDSSDFIDFIHRTTPEAEIWFLANRLNRPAQITATFRISGRRPECWDPVTGVRRSLPEYTAGDGATAVPLQFGPYGSMFIVFPKRTSSGLTTSRVNFEAPAAVQEIGGPWEVSFNQAWFYPTSGLSGEEAAGTFRFTNLEDWASRSEPAIRHFSGTAVYRTSFVWNGPEGKAAGAVWIDLGTVHETARVRLNGRDMGVAWHKPWRLDATDALVKGNNRLEVEVVNLWPNRLIGDANLPEKERRTRTNVISFQKDSPLLPSGLLGPVTLQWESQVLIGFLP
jgi:hypothetical protein